MLRLLAEGLDNRSIAGRLGKSEKTVRNQVSVVLSKLGVQSRAQAIVRALGLEQLHGTFDPSNPQTVGRLPHAGLRRTGRLASSGDGVARGG